MDANWKEETWEIKKILERGQGNYEGEGVNGNLCYDKEMC